MDIEMAHDERITLESVRYIHSQFIQNGGNSSHDTLQLVDIMGGIDEILCAFLSSSKSGDMNLTTLQLQQIYDVINTHDASGASAVGVTTTTNKHIDVQLQEELVIHLDRHETYLHLLFGFEVANKIVNGFIYNKRFLYPMLFLTNVGFLQFFRGYVGDLFITIPALVMWSVVFPWLTLVILSANIKAFKMIVRSFDFWVKVYYMLLFAVTRFIYIHYVAPSVDPARKHIVWFVYDVLYVVIRVLVIIVWSSLDSLQFPLFLKIYMGLVICIVYTLNGLYLTLYSQSNGDDSIIHITNTMSISLISYADSSIKIVSLFLWKQTIFSILKKQRCVLIKYAPFVKWSTTQAQQIQTQQNLNTTKETDLTLAHEREDKDIP